MKLKSILFSCFLIFSIISYSQNINTNPFWEGEIKFNDGTIKKGFIQVPNNPSQVRVSFKKTKNGKNERVKKKDIKSVKVISKLGKVHDFEPVAVVLTIKGNASLGKLLLLVSHKNDFAKFYISYGVYRVNNDGELYMRYRYNMSTDFPVLAYYLKKRDYKKARLFDATSLARGLKKGAKAYLTEDPELLEKINNGDLKFGDMNEIIETYLETTKNL